MPGWSDAPNEIWGLICGHLDDETKRSFCWSNKKFMKFLTCLRPREEITDEELATLVKMCPLIGELDVSFCENITNHSFPDHLDRLTSLDMRCCSQFSITRLVRDNSAALGKLRILSLYNCHIQNYDMPAIATIRTLSVLDVSRCPCITDDGLAHLRGHPSLTELDLTQCYDITDDGLAHLATLASLTTLYLVGCQNITDDGLAHLKVLAGLTLLDLSGCYNITLAGLSKLDFIKRIEYTL